MAIFRNQIKFSVEEKRNNKNVFLHIPDDNSLNFYKDKFKKYKLKNCSVLQIILKKGIFGGIGNNIKCVELEVSLFYEGSIAATEESGEGLCNYWQSNRKFNLNNYDIDTQCDDKSRFKTFKCLIPEDIFAAKGNHVFPCTLYIVRHGQAQHNLKFASHMKKDTSLTGDGITQARFAGKALQELLPAKNFKFSKFFCSDLKRTRETFVNIIGEINYKKHATDTNGNIHLVVLPCAHEVHFNSKGDCDGKYVSGLENSMNCKTKDYEYDSSECSRMNYKTAYGVTEGHQTYNRMVYFDWSYYQKFYGSTLNKVYDRNSTRGSGTSLHCSDYNFSIIDSLFDYIHSEPEQNPTQSPNLVQENTPYHEPLANEDDQPLYANVNDEPHYANEDDEPHYANEDDEPLYENTKKNQPVKYVNTTSFFEKNVTRVGGRPRRQTKRKTYKKVHKRTNHQLRKHKKKKTRKQQL